MSLYVFVSVSYEHTSLGFVIHPNPLWSHLNLYFQALFYTEDHIQSFWEEMNWEGALFNPQTAKIELITPFTELVGQLGREMLSKYSLKEILEFTCENAEKQGCMSHVQFID